MTCSEKTGSHGLLNITKGLVLWDYLISSKKRKKNLSSSRRKKKLKLSAGWQLSRNSCECIPDRIIRSKDPLDGISIYDGGSYWHFVSFGQTEIYEKETDTPDISGYGYELTFKLKKDEYEDEEAEIRNICGILQMIARLTFTKGEIFRPFEFLYTGQTAGQKSNLTGFITVKDPTVETIDTPNGRVEFLELIGMTDAELKTLSDVGSVMEIYRKLGSDITDYHRQSIV